MIEFERITERIKEVLTAQHNNHKVLDKDIAHALHLTPQYYAVIKKRKKVPYEALAYYCKQSGLSLNWLLLAQNPKYINKGTSK